MELKDTLKEKLSDMYISPELLSDISDAEPIGSGERHIPLHPLFLSLPISPSLSLSIVAFPFFPYLFVYFSP